MQGLGFGPLANISEYTVVLILDPMTKARRFSMLEVPPCYTPLLCGLSTCQWRNSKGCSHFTTGQAHHSCV